jgi:predicted nucleic acid-binding protein
MIFEDIPAGSAVFVDANTFLYYFGNDPRLGPACAQFLLRIENNDLVGFTSSHVLADVAHRLMTIEARVLFGWPIAGMAHRLKTHTAEVQSLGRYRQAIDEISLIGIQVLPVTGRLVSLAADISRQFGLLTNDALVVAVMRDHGLSALASHDADFDRVPSINRFAPA